MFGGASFGVDDGGEGREREGIDGALPGPIDRADAPEAGHGVGRGEKAHGDTGEDIGGVVSAEQDASERDDDGERAEERPEDGVEGRETDGGNSGEAGVSAGHGGERVAGGPGGAHDEVVAFGDGVEAEGSGECGGVVEVWACAAEEE